MFRKIGGLILCMILVEMKRVPSVRFVTNNLGARVAIGILLVALPESPIESESWLPVQYLGKH